QDRGRSRPQVIVDVGRNLVIALGPDRVAPLVAQPAADANLADLARLHVLHELPHAGIAAALRPRLTDSLVFAGRFDRAAAFAHVVAHRLLAVNIFAGLHGPDRGQRMPMVRRRDGDDI